MSSVIERRLEEMKNKFNMSVSGGEAKKVESKGNGGGPAVPFCFREEDGAQDPNGFPDTEVYDVEDEEVVDSQANGDCPSTQPMSDVDGEEYDPHPSQEEKEMFGELGDVLGDVKITEDVQTRDRANRREESVHQNGDTRSRGDRRESVTVEIYRGQRSSSRMDDSKDVHGGIREIHAKDERSTRDPRMTRVSESPRQGHSNERVSRRAVPDGDIAEDTSRTIRDSENVEQPADTDSQQSSASVVEQYSQVDTFENIQEGDEDGHAGEEAISQEDIQEGEEVISQEDVQDEVACELYQESQPQEDETESAQPEEGTEVEPEQVQVEEEAYKSEADVECDGQQTSDADAPEGDIKESDEESHGGDNVQLERDGDQLEEEEYVVEQEEDVCESEGSADGGTIEHDKRRPDTSRDSEGDDCLSSEDEFEEEDSHITRANNIVAERALKMNMSEKYKSIVGSKVYTCMDRDLKIARKKLLENWRQSGMVNGDLASEVACCNLIESNFKYIKWAGEVIDTMRSCRALSSEAARIESLMKILLCIVSFEPNRADSTSAMDYFSETKCKKGCGWVVTYSYKSNKSRKPEIVKDQYLYVDQKNLQFVQSVVFLRKAETVVIQSVRDWCSDMKIEDVKKYKKGVSSVIQDILQWDDGAIYKRLAAANENAIKTVSDWCNETLARVSDEQKSEGRSKSSKHTSRHAESPTKRDSAEKRDGKHSRADSEVVSDGHRQKVPKTGKDSGQGTSSSKHHVNKGERSTEKRASPKKTEVDNTRHGKKRSLVERPDSDSETDARHSHKKSKSSGSNHHSHKQASKDRERDSHSARKRTTSSSERAGGKGHGKHSAADLDKKSGQKKSTEKAPSEKHADKTRGKL